MTIERLISSQERNAYDIAQEVEALLESNQFFFQLAITINVNRPNTYEIKRGEKKCTVIKLLSREEMTEATFK